MILDRKILITLNKFLNKNILCEQDWIHSVQNKLCHKTVTTFSGLVDIVASAKTECAAKIGVGNK